MRAWLTDTRHLDAAGQEKVKHAAAVLKGHKAFCGQKKNTLAAMYHSTCFPVSLYSCGRKMTKIQQHLLENNYIL